MTNPGGVRDLLRDQLQKPRRPWEEIFLVVGSAAVVSVLHDALIDPPASAIAFAARVTSSGVRIFFAVLVGMYLGRRVWPKRGKRLGERLLRRSTEGKVPRIVVLTDRSDLSSRMSVRIFEVVGFVAGTTLVVHSGFALAGIPVALPAYVYMLVAFYASFVFVPYWAFGRMGLRRIDPVRWTVVPLAHSYARRLKLSNGTLLLIGLGATVNLAFRAGQSGDQALLGSVRIAGQLAAAILVVVASAVAYYAAPEDAVFQSLEDTALAVGIRDGRSLSDGEFLPRIL